MTFNVDECLAEIWLQTVRLRQGEQFAPGEGRRLWQTCADNVTRVREVMRTAGLTEENMLHITYACCALLDEAVKSREVQDDASLVWSLGWRYRARIMLTLPTHLLPVPVLGESPVRLGLTCVNGLQQGDRDLPDDFTVELGHYRGLTSAIINKDIQRVHYRF